MGCLSGILMAVGGFVGFNAWLSGMGLGWSLAVGFAVWLIPLALASAAEAHSKRRRLLTRYGDDAIVARILAGEVWQGMSEAMVVDSIGVPDAIDERVLKTKTKRTLKYFEVGEESKKRPKLRRSVTVENDVVVGWDESTRS